MNEKDPLGASHAVGRSRVAPSILVAVAVIAVLFAIAAGITRTTIPLELHGQVRDLIHHNRTGGRGTDFWELRWEDDERLLVDEAVDQALEDGDRVDKPAWSITFSTNRGPVRLPMPWKLLRLVVALVSVVGIVAVAAFRPRLLDRVASRLRGAGRRSAAVGG